MSVWWLLSKMFNFLGNFLPAITIFFTCMANSEPITSLTRRRNKRKSFLNAKTKRYYRVEHYKSQFGKTSNRTNLFFFKGKFWVFAVEENMNQNLIPQSIESWVWWNWFPVCFAQWYFSLSKEVFLPMIILILRWQIFLILFNLLLHCRCSDRKRWLTSWIQVAFSIY